MQNDFMPGGTLAVPNADKIVPVINQLMPHFSLVVATQDWHPQDHVSFAPNHSEKKPGDVVDIKGIPQILWPVHCVRNTRGAELVSTLDKDKIESLFYKGTNKWVDSYSAFFDNARQKSTGLHDYLVSRVVKEIYICGVATEYCVLYSVLDALELGWEVHVIVDACKGINLRSGDVDAALETMRSRGAKLTTSKAIEESPV